MKRGSAGKKSTSRTTVLALVMLGVLLAGAIWSSRSGVNGSTSDSVSLKNKNCRTIRGDRWYVKTHTANCKGGDSSASVVVVGYDNNGHSWGTRLDADDCDDMERGYDGYYHFNMPRDKFLKYFYVCGCSDDDWFGQPVELGTEYGIQWKVTVDRSPYDCGGRGWTFSKQNKDKHAGSNSKECRRFDVKRRSNSRSIASDWYATMAQEYDYYPDDIRNKYC